MEEGKLEPVKGDLKQLAGYLEVDEYQALFFAVIFSINYKRPEANIEELADHFDFGPLRILPFHNELEELVNRGLVETKTRVRRRHRIQLAKKSFLLPNQILKAILENKKPFIVKENVIKDFTGFLHDFDELVELRREDMIPSQQLFEEVEELTDQYREVDELQKIEKFGLNLEEKLLYYHVCRRTIAGCEKVIINDPLEAIFDNLRDQFLLKKSLFQEKGPLFEKNLLEWSKALFLDKRTVKLTDKSLSLLFGEDMELFTDREELNNLVKPGSISEKKLFYNPGENEKIHFLQELLKEEQLPALQNRLKENHMPAGVTVLFHGSPGTGKTETARQLARQTGREIVHVDLSDAKSMWFGESEKKVMEIFDAYNNYARKQELLPILLFNEADALFSKRRDTHHSSTAQTENAIQNILLEQLEEFEGILVATTNLTTNLDQAFDRRFLYKIQFHNPAKDVKRRIWESKLPGLKEADYEELAGKYNFSGGQIDNVARKVFTEQVLYNRAPGLEKIMAFCEDETMRRENTRIGYR